MRIGYLVVVVAAAALVWEGLRPWLAYHLINPQTMAPSRIVWTEVAITLASLGLIALVSWSTKRWSLRHTPPESR